MAAFSAGESMSRMWMSYPERGNALVLRIIRWLAMHIGYFPARLILYPITLYFLFKAGSNRTASLKYFSRLYGRPAHWGHVFRHIHCFSATILDRVFFLSNRFSHYDIEVHGLDIPHKLADRKQGALLLGTHLGSFEVLRAIGKLYRDVPFKILMYRQQNQTITEILEAIDPAVSDSVIDLARPDSLLIAKEYLDKGYFVAMLGDRVISEQQSVDIDFLGHASRLPTGPLQVAAILDVPVILFFGLYQGSRRYSVHFELLAEKVHMQRKQRQESLKPYADKLIQRIEHYVRIVPYNWFNFYDYWKD